MAALFLRWVHGFYPIHSPLHTENEQQEKGTGVQFACKVISVKE